MDTILAQTIRTFRAPRDYGNQYAFKIKAEAYQINGNQHPHFSVTGEIYHKATHTRNGDGTRACGCLHDEILKVWPKVKPLVNLHLSNADDGEPMHAEANGYYWLAGVVGGLGEEYHGASGSGAKTPDECLQILAEHLRVSIDDARKLADEVKAVHRSGYENETPESRIKYHPTVEQRAKAASIAAKNVFHAFVVAQRTRWQAEAQAGIALIKQLSAKEVA